MHNEINFWKNLSLFGVERIFEKLREMLSSNITSVSNKTMNIEWSLVLRHRYW